MTNATVFFDIEMGEDGLAKCIKAMNRQRPPFPCEFLLHLRPGVPGAVAEQLAHNIALMVSRIEVNPAGSEL